MTHARLIAGTKAHPMMLLAMLLLFLLQACQIKPTRDPEDHAVISNIWIPLLTMDEGGLMGERVNAWRHNRLWHMAESGYLIDGFENRPGVHPWQGEHLGKWLHAATLAYLVTRDEELKETMASFVERLLATQEANGYLGTYDEKHRLYVTPADKHGWDTWTHCYNLYGLLTYENYFPDERIVDACRKMGDLLIHVYGEEKHDLTQYGTRRGISATTLLESIVMLYERTGEKKYLDFAEHIVAMSDNNPCLRLMDAMLKEESVVYPGEGKGYQMMANLLGYLRLHRATGNEQYLATVLNGWEEIRSTHLLVTGGPWTREMSYNANTECFAHPEDFHPEISHVEGCCTVTWMQLSLMLFELTGQAEFFNQMERTLLNDLYGHQHPDGLNWCYLTAPNEAKPPYRDRICCCASSGPRGLEIFSHNLAGTMDGHLVINSLAPARIEFTKP
jgi:DUF1680 family protein